MTKTELIDYIDSSGCDMLKGKLHGMETKAEIIHFLKRCKCPVIKKIL